MNDLQVLIGVLASDVIETLLGQASILLQLLLLPLSCLFLEDFVVPPSNFRLEPSTRQVGVWDDDRELNVGLHIHLDLAGLVIFLFLGCLDV